MKKLEFIGPWPTSILKAILMIVLMIVVAAIGVKILNGEYLNPFHILMMICGVVFAGYLILSIKNTDPQDDYSSDRAVANGIIINPADGRYSRFNPIEGKSAEEIISWFQDVVDVELNDSNYTLALNTINLHLINNTPPFIKPLLDDLEKVQPLNAFSLELKKNLDAFDLDIRE